MTDDRWNTTAIQVANDRKHARLALCDDIEQLTEELRTWSGGLPLNNCGDFEVVYHIMNRSADEARTEFEERRGALEAMYAGVWDRRVAVEHRLHEGDMQHVFSVRFGSGRAVYRVVWIEKGVTELCEH